MKAKSKLKIAVPHKPTTGAMMNKHQQMARTGLSKAKKKTPARKMIYGAM